MLKQVSTIILDVPSQTNGVFNECMFHPNTGVYDVGFSTVVKPVSHVDKLDVELFFILIEKPERVVAGAPLLIAVMLNPICPIGPAVAPAAVNSDA